MSAKEKLKNLVSNELMPDLEEAIDEIFAMVEKEKMISLADREELEEMQAMHAECREILIEIEAGEMDEEEAAELLDGLIDVKTEKKD
ncbi:hypothetical protein [Nitratifractor sp.]